MHRKRSAHHCPHPKTDCTQEPWADANAAPTGREAGVSMAGEGLFPFSPVYKQVCYEVLLGK